MVPARPLLVNEIHVGLGESCRPGPRGRGAAKEPCKSNRICCRGGACLPALPDRWFLNLFSFFSTHSWVSQLLMSRPEVHAIYQHRQLLRVDLAACPRDCSLPGKAMLLQSLLPQAEPAAIPVYLRRTAGKNRFVYHFIAAPAIAVVAVALVRARRAPRPKAPRRKDRLDTVTDTLETTAS